MNDKNCQNLKIFSNFTCEIFSDIEISSEKEVSFNTSQAVSFFLQVYPVCIGGKVCTVWECWFQFSDDLPQKQERKALSVSVRVT